MVCRDRVPADEVLMRRIPPGTPWFEPPNRITTANFKLQKKTNELGISVYRQSIVGEDDVLSRPEAVPGSFVARATAREIRDLKDGRDRPLELDVVTVGDEDNPGHAEIRGPEPGKLTGSASRALKQLFEKSLNRR